MVSKQRHAKRYFRAKIPFHKASVKQINKDTFFDGFGRAPAARLLELEPAVSPAYGFVFGGCVGRRRRRRGGGTVHVFSRPFRPESGCVGGSDSSSVTIYFTDVVVRCSNFCGLIIKHNTTGSFPYVGPPPPCLEAPSRPIVDVVRNFGLASIPCNMGDPRTTILE